jgi:hypothetical protein
MLLLASGKSFAQEKVTLLPLIHPEKTAEYKHSYFVLYKSGSAEQIVPGRASRGWVQLDVKGSWRSTEKSRTLSEPQDGESVNSALEVEAVVKKAFNSFVFDQKLKTYDQHPYTLDQLNDRKFTWKISERGRVSELNHKFAPSQLNRSDIVSTFEQTWIPEMHPVLPEGPVGKGDTWTAKQTFTFPFDLIPEKALVDLVSTYKLKKISSKKGNVTVVIAETRQLKYRAWAFVTPVSVVYEGEGEGEAEWEIDVRQRVILSQRSKMTIQRPQVMVAAKEKPADNIKAEVTLRYSRKLDKLK